MRSKVAAMSIGLGVGILVARSLDSAWAVSLDNHKCVFTHDCGETSEGVCANLAVGAVCNVCSGDDVARACVAWNTHRCTGIGTDTCGNMQTGTCAASGACTGLVPAGVCTFSTCAA